MAGLAKVRSQKAKVVLLLFAFCLLTSHAQSPDSAPMLARIGAYVEEYYSRAQSILALETVTLQPLTRDFGFDGFARRLEYELRLEWNPTSPGDTGPARIVRDLVTVNGRPPRAGQEPRCFDPRGVSPEPLAFLLANRRDGFIFHPGPATDVDGRAAAVYEYRSVRPEPPRVEWRDECASIDLPGRSRGRVWADAETAAIVRLDEQLMGMVDIPVPRDWQRKGSAAFMTVERADMSIRYRPVAFSDPDETVMLPSTVETVVVVRNSGSPRLRITQRYTNYRRFVTGGRIVR
jgi:hypothetical protein